jgi:tetratricopeptide (TPR) repeat protein
VSRLQKRNPVGAGLQALCRLLPSLVSFACLCGYPGLSGAAPQNNRDHSCLPAGPVVESTPASDAWPAVAAYRDRAIPELESALAEIEAAAGALDHATVPALLGLGLRYREDGRHGEATAAFRRALLSIRVNRGLYSIDQAPVLEILIESLAADGRWKQAADGYDHLHWLYRRNHGNDDLRLLPVLKKLRRWHFEVYNRETGRTLEEHFLAAGQAYLQAIRIIEKCSGDRRLAYCFWHRACCADAEPDAGRCPLDGSFRQSNPDAAARSNEP